MEAGGFPKTDTGPSAACEAVVVVVTTEAVVVVAEEGSNGVVVGLVSKAPSVGL
jgi:hypothetical protein